VIGFEIRFEGQALEVIAGEPGFEFRRGSEAEDTAQIERVVEARALVVEHDVVGAGDAHDVVDAGCAEESEEGVHVVLVGFGVVGVADIATHGQAEKLAAEVIFEAGASDLLAVVQVFRADEADDGVDQHWLKGASDGVGTGFEGLLVDAVIGIGRERGALAGLEVHDVAAGGSVSAYGTARERLAGLIGFREE